MAGFRTRYSSSSSLTPGLGPRSCSSLDYSRTRGAPGGSGPAPDATRPGRTYGPDEQSGLRLSRMTTIDPNQPQSFPRPRNSSTPPRHAPCTPVIVRRRGMILAGRQPAEGVVAILGAAPGGPSPEKGCLDA